MNIFEQASRQGLTLKVTQGIIKVDDLWKLTKNQLSDLYSELEGIRSGCSKGLITSNSILSKRTELQMDIVKHIFDIKVMEEDAATKRAEVKNDLEILTQAKSVAHAKRLESLSLEQIDAEIQKLKAQL